MSLFLECPNCHESIRKTINICPFCRYNLVTRQIDEPRMAQNMPASGEKASVSASASTTAEKVTYCSQCGTKLPQEAKFCHSCGHQVNRNIKYEMSEAQSEKVRTQAPTTQKARGLRCPQCGSDDRIQKVSSIITGQTQHISGESWGTQVYVDKAGKKRYEDQYIPYSGTQMSSLAIQLSAPIRPDAGSNASGITIAVALVAFAGLCGCIGVNAEARGWYIVFALVLGFIGLAIGGLSERNHKEHSAQVMQIELPRWNKAMERWNQLYYCSRDDGVFIPSKHEFVPISQMTEYIFRQEEQALLHTITPISSNQRRCPDCGTSVASHEQYCPKCTALIK